MPNLNNSLCDCEGTYNEATGNCDPLLPNSPNPCPTTTGQQIWGWISQNVSIGGGGGNPSNTGLQYNQPVEKDNTAWYILGGVVVVGVIYFAMKKK